VLKFLADECCDFAVVRALRAKGYDVSALSETMSRSVDREVIEQSRREQRILLTEDKDFGWLVFVSHAESAGVILIRFPGNARTALAQTLENFVAGHGDEIANAFVVIQPGQIRISRKPE
jgi:predicted nuclease of predicted toxin-antitoxin system